MNPIQEEAIKEVNEQNEENQSKRKIDKYQTFLPKKLNFFHSPGKSQRNSVFVQSIQDKKKDKKKLIFSEKKIDQIFINKIKDSIINSSVFDMLGIKEKNKKNYDMISQEYKKYEQKLGFNLTYNDRKSIKDDKIDDIQKILNILSLSPEKRTFNNVFVMKKYLLNTKIDWLFKDEFENKEESIEKLLTFFGLEMKFKYFREGEEIFKVGDPSVYLYLIIKGKIEILKPTPEITFMSGYEYFSYIMYLKKRSEEHLLNINLEENYKEFDINKNEIELLPSIFIHHIIELIKTGKNLNFEEELSVLHMTLDELNLTQEVMSSYENLSKHLEQNLPFVPSALMKKYSFVVDKENKKKLKLIKYTRVLILESDEFFGESAMGENEKRNATIRVLENSYLGYLSASLYKTNFFAEKKLAMQNKIIFLNNRFFFKNINLKKFAKKYFNLFVYEKYLNGTVLFRENEPLNYVYFIEDGQVELSSTKTMLEIEIFLRGLEEKFSLKSDENNLNYNALKSRTKDLENYLNKTQNLKILIVGKNESLGIESFYYGIPYYATAKVASQRAKIFKISIEQLRQIINIEMDCLPSLKNLVLNKIKILRKRLFSMNNTKLILLDNKVIFNYEFDFNDNIKNQTQLLNKKKKDKNELIYKDLKIIKNFTLTPKNIITRNKKRNTYFNQKETNSNSIYFLIKSSRYDFIQEEKIKNMKKRINLLYKIPSFEDRWLNHAKNDIKSINNDKNFVSLYNNDNHKYKFDNENNDKKTIDDESEIKNKFKKNKISFNNNEIEKMYRIKNSIFLDNNIKTPNLKSSNSAGSILPSLSKNKQKENSNKFSSLNYSMSMSNENNLIKTSLNSNKNSTIFNNIFESYNNNINKNNFKKTYIKLSHKKFNNFYEIKSEYDKKKFKFYNDSEIFINNKDKKYYIDKDNQIIIQNSL